MNSPGYLVRLIFFPVIFIVLSGVSSVMAREEFAEPVPVDSPSVPVPEEDPVSEREGNNNDVHEPRRMTPPVDRVDVVNGGEVVEKLEEITVDEVDWENVPMREVVRTLSILSEELDPDEEEPRGVNIVLMDPDGRKPEVSMRLRNVSLLRVLELTAESVGFHLSVERGVVILRPEPPLRTEIFPLSREALRRMLGELPEDVLRRLEEEEEIEDPFRLPHDDVVDPFRQPRDEQEDPFRD